MRGRSVLVATKDQLTAALALLELDGIARRLILYPPDLPLEHVPFVIASASVDAIVSDRTAPEIDSAEVRSVIQCNAKIEPADYDRSARFATEWILLTSGTTGRPKMVVHTLASLAGAVEPTTEESVVWSTFYDIRRYGGLQIFLRSILTDASLVLSSADESTADFLVRAGARRSDAYFRNAIALASSADEPCRPHELRLDTFACREKSRIRRFSTISNRSIRRPPSPMLSPRPRRVWRLKSEMVLRAFPQV